MPPHHAQLTVSPSAALGWGASEKSSARAALEARRPTLGESRSRCPGRAPAGDFATNDAAWAIADAESAAAPTGFPQSMQYIESAVFERPQNAQSIKRVPPGKTPVRRVNIGRGQREGQ